MAAVGIAALSFSSPSSMDVHLHSKELLEDPWTQLLSVNSGPATVPLDTPMPAGHKYLRITVKRLSTSSGILSYMNIIAPEVDIFEFNSPPASGTITADYTIDYVPKDVNHVLDLQATIQYGEIV